MDGGSINREVPVKVWGEDEKMIIITSHDTVEIGEYTFNRDDLLVALGVNPEKSGAVV